MSLKRDRARVVVLASQCNAPITRALVRGATDVLRRHRIAARRIRLVWVPGAFELPVVAARIAASRRPPEAIIALGAILQGETIQYEVLAHAVAESLAHVAVRSRIPVTCGVVVAKTPAQARARAGLSRHGREGAMGNRGAEAAEAALAVVSLFHRLKK